MVRDPNPDKPCPSCGHCPTCGRSGAVAPYWPYGRWPVYPQPQPWWGQTGPYFGPYVMYHGNTSASTPNDASSFSGTQVYN